MKLQSFLQMLLFAGLPFVLSAVVCAALLRKICRSGSRTSNGNEHKKSAVAQWAENNKMSLTLGAAFLLMLIIAAGVGLICIKLSASVQAYYVICGTAMGAAAGTAIAVLTPPKE